ncbi:hypothetical protein Sjap_009073 [Stephania japonica]|uniref:R13L1/DRL21-like LRR repeat region domain-containing protein n=1 Tax=Stephania japonica TaxID=461633 RepID=A0AAP0JR91_9MAGN
MEFFVGDDGDELLVLEVLRPHTNLQRLSIEGFGGVKFPAWVSSGSDLPNLVRMKLSNCNHCEHIPSFGGLHRLKELELRSMANLKEWLEGGGVMFPYLEKLLIKDCPDLNKTPEHVFPSLKSLDLENVSGMGVVSITSSLTSLTSLTITKCKDLEYLQEGLVSNNSQLNAVVISNCPKLKAFRDEGLASASVADEILPNRFLRELVIDDSYFSYAKGFFKISNCPELEPIGKGFLSSLVFLKSFRVGGWSKLKRIELSQSFNHLRHLEINKCPYFEGFDISTTTQQQLVHPCCHTLKISYCPAISSIDFQSFASLRELRIFNCEGLQALQGLPFLTALQELEIHECPAISSIDFQSFASLRELQITYCRGLQALQGLPFLTTLQKLTIHLSYSKDDDAVEINQLQHLSRLMYLEMKSFNCLTMVPEWLGNFASLEELIFTKCMNLRQLPSKEQMLRLTSLKELTIYECDAISSIDLPTLPSLHKLYIYDCPEISYIDLPTLPSLHKLYIYYCPKISSIDLSTLPSLRELIVHDCEKLQVLQGFQFLTALQELLLGPFSEELNDFPLTISANDDDASSLQSNNPLILPCLRELRIHGWDALESLPHHLQRFTTLKFLQIRDFSKLTELPEWLGNLTSLEELSIKEFKNLSHLPSKEQMQRLTLLQKLVIDHCPGLKESCSEDGEEWPKISHIPDIWIDWTRQRK